MKKGFWTVVKDIMRKADAVLEILDARMPELTRNRKLEEYAAERKKPLIFVINKADIVSGDMIRKIRSEYQGLDYVLVSSKTSGCINELIRLIKNKVKKDKIKVAFIGYPNTGKSSLINNLSRKGRARTSPESGFTRGIQLIAGKGNLMLFDTPGVVPYEGRDEIRLGLVSGISPSKLNEPDLVAYELIKMFKKNNPTAIERVYGINPELELEEVLIEFGRKKNMLKKGGVVDERRAAIQILNDWHNGKIRI